MRPQGCNGSLLLGGLLDAEPELRHPAPEAQEQHPKMGGTSHCGEHSLVLSTLEAFVLTAEEEKDGMS